MKYKSVTGVRDVLPAEQPYWRLIEQKISEITQLYGYVRVDPPIFEETQLFERGVGDTTDIVEKEMYTFKDKGDHNLTLRPEFTAGVMRLYLQNGLHKQPKPVKLYSIGPIFRYERPQAGRFRQHNQFNVEAVGEQDPALDFEIMSIAWQLYSELGFSGLKFQLNSTGCPRCRPAYIEKLKEYYTNHYNIICNNCKSRLDRNPLRLLDCKEEQCQPVIAGAPVISEYLCSECKEHFIKLQSYLKDTGRQFEINHKLVRGLDYYTKTVFEVWVKGIGSQNAMCGGGRYDGLLEQLGGEPTPGIGFGSGMERIIRSMQEQDIHPPALPTPQVYICPVGNTVKNKAIQLTASLRESNIGVYLAYGQKSMKAMMRDANRKNCKYAVIIGETELEQKKLTVKILKTGEQQVINLDALTEYLKS